jgi:hypothetical protein
LSLRINGCVPTEGLAAYREPVAFGPSPESAKTHDRVVVEAVGSTLSAAKFPDSREKYRKISVSPHLPKMIVNYQAKSKAYTRFPINICRCLQGIARLSRED